MPGIDAGTSRAESGREGEPLRFASPYAVSATPSENGSWVRASGDGTSVWRLRVSAPGSVSLNLGFDRYRMPAGGRLFLYSPDKATVVGPFTEADNESHGELWTPVLAGDELVIEVQAPARLERELELGLGSVNRGFRDIRARPLGDQGWCNIDVVCSEGDDWRSQIRSVAMILVKGEWVCSGAVVNNTASDLKPYFLTANHCVASSAEAASTVVYWNYESPNCGDRSGGTATSQTGAFLRATHYGSDVSLIELDDAPVSTLDLYWSGWDASAADPASGVGIHHPSGGEKSLSFDNDALTTTDYGGTRVVPGGSYLRVGAWDQGTTEPGSSGSPLYAPNGVAVGVLAAGLAACGNGHSDWYGRVSTAWTGGGTKTSRLSDWLHPGAGTVSSLSGRDNSVVEAVGTIPDENMQTGASALQMTMATAFNDPDGDVVTYAASSSAASIATVALSGSRLTLTPVAAGSTTITVSAHDAASADAPASQTFTATVAAPAGNLSPAPVGTLADLSLRVGDAAAVVDVSDAFSDSDGDALTYAAASSAPSVASVAVSGANVTIAAKSAGTAWIVVRATDASGSNTSATQAFDAAVAVRGVTVSESSLSVTEGSSETYTVVLDAEPTGTVTVTPSVPSGTDVSVSPSPLTFSTTDWSTAQTVTVSAAEDDDADTDAAVTVSHAVSGADYGSVTAPSVEVTIVENDTATPPDDGDDDDNTGGGSPGGAPGGGPGGGDPDDDEAGSDDEDDGDGGAGPGAVGPPDAAIELDADCPEDLCRARTGAPVRFRDASSGSLRFRQWEFGDGRRSRSAEVRHAWTTPGFYLVTLTVGDGDVESVASRLFLVEASDPAGTCQADTATLCLRDSRFAVRASWFTADGRSGAGQVVRAGTNDSGLFRFFDPENWEVLIKVLDGCALNGRVWVFGASTTDLGYSVEVTDTASGEVREYRNEPGRPAPAFADSEAFVAPCAAVE